MTESNLREIRVPRLVVGGVTSGVGKTTFVAGLIGALCRRGLRVASFKVGPDYIDPSYHSRVSGRPCRNLDSWMVPGERLVELFARSTAGADVAIVEGVMGLFDGRHGQDDGGSTAQVARLLGAPVVLLMSAARTSRSAGAMALGYRQFDPRVRLAGVVLNQVGSPAHRETARQAVEGRAGLPVLGHLPRRADLSLPERHLGLVPTGESAPDDGFFAGLIGQVETTIDVDRLLEAARSADPVPVEPTGLFPGAAPAACVRIGVALDRAFTFYYHDNLDLLQAWGAELVPFSPLTDGRLPRDLHGLYIGGGFPELFAAELAANRSMLESIRAEARQGLPIYAECGGLMYLSEGIVDFEHRRHPLVGILPAWSAMRGRRLTVGYRTATARAESLLLRRGESVRGHEFHWSQLDPAMADEVAAYDFEESPGPEGYVRGRVLASYLHLHFATPVTPAEGPGLAPRFVQACLEAKSPVCSALSSPRLEPVAEPDIEAGGTLTAEHHPGSGDPLSRPGTLSMLHAARDFAATAPPGPPGYPVNLRVANRTVVVVGGGRVAERKALALVDAGARVVVVSPELTEGLRQLRGDGRLSHIPRSYQEGDLAGAFLAFAATDQGEVNHAVAREAQRRSVLVDVVDDGRAGDFSLPAVLRRGDLSIAISTGGRSPAMARWLRDDLESYLASELVGLLDLAAEVREDLRARGESVPNAAWQRALGSDLRELLRRGRRDEARARLLAVLGSGSAPAAGDPPEE